MAAQEPPKELQCPQCFTVNQPGSEFCESCGATFNAQSEGSDAEIYKELAQANLKRMRGDHRGAISEGLAALKRYPNNSTAHILIADIHAELGEQEQAIEWYEMAQDLAPDDETIATKLEAVRCVVEEEQDAEVVQELGIERKEPKMGLFVGIMAAAIILVGVAAFFIGRQVSAARAGSEPQAISAPINVGTPPESMPAAPATEPTTEPQTGEPAAATTTVAVDSAILTALQRSAPAGLSYLSIFEEPRRFWMLVTVEGSGEPEATSVRAAQHLFSGFAKYQGATIRVTQGGAVVFVTDVYRSTLQEVESGLEEGQDLTQFAAQILVDSWPQTEPS